MVALAERMRASVRASRAAQGSASSSSSNDGGTDGGNGRSSDGGNSGVLAVNEEELQDLLLSIGITAPVTKESAGASYHKQLAAQVREWWVGGRRKKSSGLLLKRHDVCFDSRQ